MGTQVALRGIKTTELSQKSEPRRVWPLESVHFGKMVGTWSPSCPFLLEQWVGPAPDPPFGRVRA